MINITKEEEKIINKHKKIIIERLERDYGDISYYNHNRIKSLIENRFAIMLEEEFKVKKNRTRRQPSKGVKFGKLKPSDLFRTPQKKGE